MGAASWSRVVDAGLLVGTAILLATGIGGLFVGGPDGWVVIALHGIVGLAFLPLLAVKLVRVRHRLSGALLSAPIALSVLLTLATLATIATGIGWVLGVAPWVGAYSPLVIHGMLGIVVAFLLGAHLIWRFHPPSRAVLTDRRAALQTGGALVAGAVAWRSQAVINRTRDLAPRRFTGSREAGSDAGNAFPVTSWVADDPEPIDVVDWRLRVDGRVETPVTLTAADLGRRAGTRDRAVLDCTSGWYSDHEWDGIRIGDLLAVTGVDDEARWVSVRSVTGYRWSLPLPAARDALLATHVDGEPLSHGHGAPLRLVAPGRRGFQWVKWVDHVQVRQRRDLSEWLAIFVSGI